MRQPTECFATMGGERVRIIPTIAEARRCGAWNASKRNDAAGYEAYPLEDGAQDGALAFIELQARGANPVRYSWWLENVNGDSETLRRSNGSIPPCVWSTAFDADALPVWAE